MSNGSLGEMLHGSKGGHLQWESRYRIVVEAAEGMCYLHHDCSLSIILRDVKSNNILLDQTMKLMWLILDWPSSFMLRVHPSVCLLLLVLMATLPLLLFYGLQLCCAIQKQGFQFLFSCLSCSNHGQVFRKWVSSSSIPDAKQIVSNFLSLSLSCSVKASISRCRLIAYDH